MCKFKKGDIVVRPREPELGRGFVLEVDKSDGLVNVDWGTECSWNAPENIKLVRKPLTRAKIKTLREDV